MMIEIIGALRMQNSEAVKQHLINFMTEGTEKLYLYLAQLTEIDSAGLGVLVGLHMTARKKKIDFYLTSPTEFQWKLFEATRMTSVFNLLSGIEAESLRSNLVCDRNKTELPVDFVI